MPAVGGVSNYAFPIPFPGRKDHCSIQVSIVTMMMMMVMMMMMMMMVVVVVMMMMMMIPIGQVSASTIVMTGGLDTEDLVTEVAPWMLMLIMLMLILMIYIYIK